MHTLAQGRFELRRELGRGGMGVVYEAWDTERSEAVALKLLHRTDPQAVLLLKQEFRWLSEVTHPRLLPMYELLGDGERWFFTMELVAGGQGLGEHLQRLRLGTPEEDTLAVTQADAPTLDASTLMAAPELSGTAPAPPEASQWPPLVPEQIAGLRNVFLQLAEGISALHSQGKLHRDLKPSNVMLRRDGSVVILDFGLAVAKDQIAPEQAGHIAGTIGYMAPEQAAGRAATEASDWYALGVMLFQALSGSLPFSGRPQDVLLAKQASDPPEISRCVDGVPGALAELCGALLARQPARRPAAGQILAALGGVAATSELAAPLFVGRQDYLERLRAAFERSRQGPVLVQLRGRSGAGKSALLQEFLRRTAGPSAGPQGELLVFRSRCYEQESVPYKTMDGLADAMAQWLAGLPADQLRALVPKGASALAQVFPCFKQLPGTGSAPRTRDLELLRRQAFAAMGELMLRMAEQMPLVLCVDDLQWGDTDGTVMLLEGMRQGPKALLVVTHRDEYQHSSAALRTLATGAQMPGLEVLDLALQPLPRAEAEELVRRRHPEATAAQVDEITAQAEGNPYFLEELARPASGGVAGMTLEEVLWRRMQQLADAERRLLEAIAVSGQPIRLQEAQAAAGLESATRAAAALRTHRLARSSGPGIHDEIETYHDRIRETLLRQLGPERLARQHAQLAVCLEASGATTPDTLARHFEAGQRPSEAGRYYEQAGAQAAAALAFRRAEEMYEKARDLSGDAETRARVTLRLIHLNTDLARFPAAYRLGKEALQELGLRIPASFQPPGFAADLARFWLSFRGRAPASIVELPVATDGGHIARIALLAAIGKAAYQIRPELCIAIMLKIVNSSLKWGNTPDSAIGYMAVGSIFVGGILGRYRSGAEFGQASLQLVERYNAVRIRAEVNFVVGYFGTSWRRPAQEAEALWDRARRAGLESGDYFHFGCACCAAVMSRFLRGADLESLEADIGEMAEQLERFGLEEPRRAVLAVGQAVAAARHGSQEPVALPEGEFGSRHFAHYGVLLRMQQQVLSGDYPAARETARISARYLPDSRGMLHGSEHWLWSLLADMALAGRGWRRWLRLRKARGRIQKYERWARNCPANFLAKARVLQAAHLAATGRTRAARERLLLAERAALEYNQPHVAALACQLAAVAAAGAGDRQDETEARSRARQHWRRWGANALARAGE